MPAAPSAGQRPIRNLARVAPLRALAWPVKRHEDEALAARQQLDEAKAALDDLPDLEAARGEIEDIKLTVEGLAGDDDVAPLGALTSCVAKVKPACAAHRR